MTGVVPAKRGAFLFPLGLERFLVGWSSAVVGRGRPRWGGRRRSLAAVEVGAGGQRSRRSWCPTFFPASPAPRGEPYAKLAETRRTSERRRALSTLG